MHTNAFYRFIITFVTIMNILVILPSLNDIVETLLFVIITKLPIKFSAETHSTSGSLSPTITKNFTSTK